MAEPSAYVKEAFKRQENLITLGGLAVAGAVFNPGFLLLGAALELAYLWTMASNARFRRVVDSQLYKARSLFGDQEKERLLAAIPRSARDRYQELAAIREKVFDSWQSRDPVTRSLLQPGVEKLDYLLDSFLKAQTALHRMREHLGESDLSLIEKQAKMVEAELAGGLSDTLREAKARHLDLLRQRIARLKKLQEDLALARTQLDTLENAVRFVSDQSVSLSDPQQISAQIDRAVAEVGDTEKTIQDVETFLSGAEEGAKRRTPQGGTR